jgi:hypothetical protein
MTHLLQRTVLTVVIIHAAITAVHGFAHAQIPVPSTAEQGLFIGVVIILAPFAALAAQLMSRPGIAARTLFLAMLGSEVFGAFNHLLIPGVDNIAEIPATGWGSIFVWSATALIAVEGIGIAVGALAILQSRQARHESAALPGIAEVVSGP